MQEKIRCLFCGRRNHIDNDLCESCGAWLPEPLQAKEIVSVFGLGISGSFSFVIPTHNLSHSFPGQDTLYVGWET